MKLLRCDGKTLEVRDVSEVIYRLLARDVPIKLNGWRLVSDDEARSILTELRALDLYDGGRVQ